MIKIVLKSGTANGGKTELEFNRNSVTIGRVSSNDLCVDADGVSRYHAQVSKSADGLIVEDLGSTNGVLVNAEKIDGRAIVSPKDIITIGSSMIVCEDLADDVDESPTEEREVEFEPSVSETHLELSPVVEPDVAPEKVDFYWKSMESFLQPVWEFILDDSVSEIMINGTEEVYVEKKGQLSKVDTRFPEEKLKAAVLNIAQYVGRRVSEDEPYLDARLPDGSRVAVLMPPCARKGISIAIRKFSKESLTLQKLLDFGSLSEEIAVFLDACVKLKKNIIVSGGTSSGKTSLLNVVSSLIPVDERIITIEDSAELQLGQDHVVPMETKAPDKKGRGQVTMRDLLRASLRMRPDRIVVGEIRAGEALDLLQAMNTGHSGSMATVHASSPLQALTRLETLALFSGVDIPISALREQVSTAVEIVIQASRLPDHSRKVVYISEVRELGENGSYQMNEIFRFKREGRDENGVITGKHELCGEAPRFLDELELAGLTDALALFR